jgi:hypothetical protein
MLQLQQIMRRNLHHHQQPRPTMEQAVLKSAVTECRPVATPLACGESITIAPLLFHTTAGSSFVLPYKLFHLFGGLCHSEEKFVK